MASVAIGQEASLLRPGPQLAEVRCPPRLGEGALLLWLKWGNKVGLWW